MTNNQHSLVTGPRTGNEMLTNSRRTLDTGPWTRIAMDNKTFYTRYLAFDKDNYEDHISGPWTSKQLGERPSTLPRTVDTYKD